MRLSTAATFIFILALFQASQSAPQHGSKGRGCDPNAACPLHYSPVCGSDGKTYGNDCALRVEACAKGTLRIVHNGQCGTEQPACDTACIEIYAPVCGTDGKTYDNDCFLKREACTSGDQSLRVDYEGKCRNERSECPTICTADYTPVCGTDGETYSNICQLEVAACLSGDTSLKKKYDGECRNEQSECPTICTADFTPVCGTDGQTYSNICQLEVDACLSGNTSLKKKYDGQCRNKRSECPTICGAVYAPVCGTDGQTYGNMCELEVAACLSGNTSLRKKYEGQC